ncbi:MAG: hypothetical protein HY891_04450 [Deltaproteobacteria bacterium]|nr:hypothetical protein [Deltaproteobacteria bacterium]
MKILKILMFTLLIAAMPVIGSASEVAKTSGGIKAVLNVDPAKSMVDLYLSDSKTQKEISGAKVKAAITLPNGEKVEKELMGMKMGDSFSFMNTLDMSRKGSYIFDITVDLGKTTHKFNFHYDV